VRVQKRERGVRRQDGREGTPTARREERGKVSSPGQRAHHCQHHGTLWYVHTHIDTHTHTHTRLANGPPSCPIRNCLISCAKQPLPCQPWCHLLPNNMAADQTSAHTHTHTHTHTASLIPGTAPLLSHRDTHIKLHRHRCSPKVSTLSICTKACIQTHLIAGCVCVCACVCVCVCVCDSG